MPDAMGKEIGTLAAEEGEVLDVFGATLVVKGDPAVLGVFLGEHVVPPGYVVLDGADQRRLLRPGATAHLPAGSRHGFRNDTAAPVRFLVMLRPGSQSVAMFRHFDRAGRTAPGGLTPQAIVAIAAQHGVSMG
jgi:hypothetical protein